MMRWLCVVLGVALAGCGLIRDKEEAEKRAALIALRDASLAQCDQQFPAGAQATAIARATCQNAAYNQVRPLFPFPDLLDVDMANRSAIAERLQKGQITLAQANEELAARRSQLVAEEQRRSLAHRSVGAQEAIADASYRAAGPKTCTQIGNSVHCY